MVLKKRRSRSTKRSSKTKVKSTASKDAGKNDAGRAVELRDEQNGGVTEETGREGIIDYFLGLPNEIEATVTSVLNFPTWCMDVAANDVDGIAAILGEEVGGNTIQSEEISREKAVKAAKKKAAYLKAMKEEKQKEAEKKALEEEKQKEAEKVAQKEAETAVVQKETKKEAAARKKAEKNAMKASKKAAKEDDKNTALLKTNPPPPPPVMQTTEEKDKNQVDESDIEKLLQQLQEEQKQLSDVDKKRTDVEAKILATITMIKNAANEAEMDSMIQEILTWENSCSFDDGTATESSFISAEEKFIEKEFIDVVADRLLCIGI